MVPKKPLLHPHALPFQAPLPGPLDLKFPHQVLAVKKQLTWLGRWEISQLKSHGPRYQGKVQERATGSDISEKRVPMGSGASIQLNGQVS